MSIRLSGRSMCYLSVCPVVDWWPVQGVFLLGMKKGCTDGVIETKTARPNQCATHTRLTQVNATVSVTDPALLQFCMATNILNRHLKASYIPPRTVWSLFLINNCNNNSNKAPDSISSAIDIPHQPGFLWLQTPLLIRLIKLAGDVTLR